MCYADWCGTYNAYCIAPFFSTWEASGSSRFGFPVTDSGRPEASDLCVSSLAGFGAEEEIEAIALYGIIIDAGLAIYY